MHLVEQHGLENCGFLTLTFGDHLDWRESQRRFNNFARRVLRPLFKDYIRVLEFQRNGNPHYHLAVACHGDIRSGFNFTHYRRIRAWNKGRRTGPRPFGSLDRNALLVELHERLNNARLGYRVGRIELAPIETSAEAIGRYVGGYLSKGLPGKRPEHKGARLVCYSQGFQRAIKGRFSWTDGGREWRQKLAIWAEKHGCHSLEEVKCLFGPRWAYFHGDHIAAVVLSPPPPSVEDRSEHPRQRSPEWAEPPRTCPPGQEGPSEIHTPPARRALEDGSGGQVCVVRIESAGMGSCSQPESTGCAESYDGKPPQPESTRPVESFDRPPPEPRKYRLGNRTLVPRLHLQKRLQI